MCRIHPTSIGMAHRKGRSREGEGNGPVGGIVGGREEVVVVGAAEVVIGVC